MTVHEEESWGDAGSCWICDRPLFVDEGGEAEHFRKEHPTAHEYGCNLTKLDRKDNDRCNCKRAAEDV